jgi:hypothetical protein
MPDRKAEDVVKEACQIIPIALLGVALAAAVAPWSLAQAGTAPAKASAEASGKPPGTVRFATFNIFELSCAKIDATDADGRFAHPQLLKAAEILRRVQPEILLLNEIDYDGAKDCARLFAERYLASPRGDLAPLALAHRVYLPVNTGVPSGMDLNNDGDSADPEDAYGFGVYPGQYGMAVLSKYPIDAAAVRTFQNFLWRDMPKHWMPDGQGGRPAFYSADEAARLRLSSKSHWDVPVQVGGRVVHLLICHPVPPVFDGPEDANGRRNFDEVRLWADYLTGGAAAEYLVDDQGRRGGLAADASFVLMGDLNADPVLDTAKPYGRTSVSQLLEHPRVQDPKPRSEGDHPGRPGRKETPYPGDSLTRTAYFGRADYLLPSRDLEVAGSGVFYPKADDPLYPLVADPDGASDHHLVWLDLRLAP